MLWFIQLLYDSLTKNFSSYLGFELIKLARNIKQNIIHYKYHLEWILNFKNKNVYTDNIVSFCVSYDLIAKVVKIVFFCTKGCLIDGSQYVYI